MMSKTVACRKSRPSMKRSRTTTSLDYSRYPKSSNRRKTEQGTLPYRITFRVQGLPHHLSREDTRTPLARTLELQELDSGPDIHSLARSPYRQENVATISFQDIPYPLSAYPQKTQWQFDLPQNDSHDRHDKRLQISIDTHFSGFTPFSAITA